MSQSSSSDSLKRPQSATHGSTGLIGLAAFIYGAWLTQFTQWTTALETLAVIGFGAGIMILWEALVFKTHRRDSTGINWNRTDLNPNRAAVKYIGLIATLGVLSFFYFLFPEYDKGMYDTAWDAAKILVPFVIPAAFFYILLVDMLMKNPEDGYYQIGLLTLGQYKRVDKTKIAPHIRSWLIKGFFIPLMFTALAGNLQYISGNIGNLHDGLMALDIFKLCMATVFFLFTLDLIFTVTGYIFSSRLIDTHERSSEPTLLGWMVALICYQPFWSLIDRNYLDKGPSPNWPEIVANHPVPSAIWAFLYVASIAVYSWATMAFGMRFSNLTHRGIITSGPYRFTKHPAYISKNISWWMLAAPFLIAINDPVIALKTSVVLLIINGIYYLRAKTEERHLMQDQTYRDYAAWMDHHGIFRWWPLKGTWPLK